MKISAKKQQRIAAKRAAGFTLVETILAVASGSVMLSALYATLVFGVSVIRTTREDLRASQILVSRMERIRLCTWSQVTNPLYNPLVSTTYASDDKQTPYTVTFKPTVPAIGSFPEAYRTNMLVVTVEVNWTSGGLQRKRSMQTYVAKDGVQSYVSGN
jgi:hypothetical protein